MFSGTFTALITPFKNNSIDYDSLEKLIEYQINNGISGIVPVGTTGEGTTLSLEETYEIFKFVREKTKGKAKVIGGTGTNSTEKTIENTKLAYKAGLDAALIVTPYYNKPTQDGLKSHYEAIAKKVDIPVVLYNVPGRTSINLEADTTIELSNIKNIVGIKEASGRINQITKIIRDTGDDFCLLSGEDALNLPILSLGGNGFISVTSNIAPKLVSELYKSFVNNDIKKCIVINNKLLDLNKSLFIETNPIPVKAGVNLMGLCEKEIRLPLVWITDYSLKFLQTEMIKLNLL